MQTMGEQMYSIVINGKVLDYKFRNYKLKFMQNFYVGNIFIGQIFKMKKGNWSCVPKNPHPLAPMDGFRSRFDAAECLLKMEGYRRKERDER